MKRFVAEFMQSKAGIGLSQVQAQRALQHSMAQHNTFRSLNGHEAMAVSVNDNRVVEEGNPNNSMLISCDHASNELSLLYTTPVEEPYILSNDGFDPGAADFANQLAEQAECLSV